jgi:7-cyano-7-deazaguanine synthase
MRLEFTMKDVQSPLPHGRNVALSQRRRSWPLCHISRIVCAAGRQPISRNAPILSALSAALSLGLASPIEITAPFAHLSKPDVVRIGAGLGVPLELTLSCMNPSDLTHCGLCSKCRERRDAFQAAGVEDPTVYANASPR